MFIKRSWKFIHIQCHVNNITDIYLCNFSLYVLTVYHPPSNSSDNNSSLLHFISEFCTNKEVILQGDFNLPSLKWDNVDVLDTCFTI